MDEREPRMADTEDRLRRTMETILEPHRRPRRRARPGAPRVTTIDRLRHPSISEAGTRAAGINPEPIPSGGVTRWTAQARQDRVPRRAADLMDKRAQPRSKRPRPRSGRGVRCTRHPCRQASLRVSPRRGAGRPHPQAMGARSVIHCVQHPARSRAAGWVRFASQAPARFAPELAHPRQDRPRPFGRRAWPTPPACPVTGVRSW